MVFAAMDHQHKAAHRQYEFRVRRRMVEVVSGKDHATSALINARNSAHDFSVTLSPCMCSHSSYPGYWYM